jgi:hypothetical protein
MGWFTRFTRFGDPHLVYSQEADNSCGIACVRMVVFKTNKLTPGSKATYAEQQIYTRYSIASSATYTGSAYTFTNHLATTLNGLDCGVWEQANVGVNGVSDAIFDSVGTDYVGAGPIANAIHRNWPIIVLVHWDANNAHFVCVDTVNNFLGSTYASVCDPWDGDVHITPIKRGSPFGYVGQPNRSSWAIGTPEHNYSGGGSSGAAQGWVVRRKS